MVDYICKHIVKSIHASVRIYRNNLQIANYGKSPDTIDIFESDPIFEQELLSKAHPQYPVLFIEEKSLVYVMIHDGKDCKYIIGPVCMQPNLLEALQKIRNHHGDKIACNIPIVNLEFFCDEVLLLHNLIHKTELTFLQLTEKNFLDDSTLHSIEKELFTVSFSYSEKNELHNPHDRELREIECIKQGDSEQLASVLDEVFPGKYGTLSKDPLRNSKNLAICGMMVASRAAISGGILPELAYTICDAYVLKIDEATTIGQPEALVRQAKFHYAKIVADSTKKKYKNQLVENCKNMIYQQMHGKIKIKEIADNLSINPDYLSHIFYKVEKVKIHDFIENEKIIRAVNMLMYSEYSIAAIGQYLGFSSQSHFGTVFKKKRGLSPKQFRDQNKPKNFYTKQSEI